MKALFFFENLQILLSFFVEVSRGHSGRSRHTECSKCYVWFFFRIFRVFKVFRESQHLQNQFWIKVLCPGGGLTFQGIFFCTGSTVLKVFIFKNERQGGNLWVCWNFFSLRKVKFPCQIFSLKNWNLFQLFWNLPLSRILATKLVPNLCFVATLQWARNISEEEFFCWGN